MRPIVWKFCLRRPALAAPWQVFRALAAAVTFPWQPGGRAGQTHCQRHAAALLAGRLGDMVREGPTRSREGAVDRATGGEAVPVPRRVFTRAPPTCVTQGLPGGRWTLQRHSGVTQGARSDPHPGRVAFSSTAPLGGVPGAAAPTPPGYSDTQALEPMPGPSDQGPWGWAGPPAFNEPPSGFPGRLPQQRAVFSGHQRGCLPVCSAW